MSLAITERDQELFDALTRRVRVMSLGQATRLLQHTSGALPPTGRTLRHRMERLARAGWLEIYPMNVHRIASAERPLATWALGKRVPDAAKVATQTKGRWREAPIVVAVCVASARTANMLGSTAVGLPRREQLDHDLLLSSVYLRFRTSCLSSRVTWIGEHGLPKAGYRIKDPDAFLVDGRGRVVRVVESAGRYNERQIEAFHEYCSERGYAYELW
jgi:hypothetical protein